MSLKGMYDQKLQKMAEQKQLSDEMNSLLTKHMNPSSKEVKRNLTAAIAQSKSPGYFQYYVPTDEVKQAESQKVLNSLARKIAKVHNELEQLNNEIVLATASSKGRTPEDQQLSSVSEWFVKNGGRVSQLESAAPSSLSGWFDTFGKPAMPGAARDMLSKFDNNPKIYGGTSHHRSFKSKAVTLTKGRLTR